ncbi:hypothetical protein EV385_0799 [Krasilnikovia cinnamomea]|uniref:Lipoprotein n=1 Tax=Krasilnikovia cinnamomea TaxID=349313 RepID=A0A4Q7ZFG5_9ACTN|nr:hypothetical protein [Krasilnikovia cinnamomea]RZU49064.1 hypothetical protein EV385_0799 [Krasilnikovia cinnamomea]
MTRTRLAGVVLVGALAVAGCDDGPRRLDGNAAPAGGSPPTSAALAPSALAPSAPGSPAPAPSTTPPAAGPKPSTSPAALVLGPQGLGALKLGMTLEQARATGMIVGYKVEDFTGHCGISKLRGTNATVFFTPGLGLSSIDMYGGIRTPEGIRLGSSIDGVRKAYPDWEEIVGGGDTGYGWADTPGNRKAGYRIDVRKGKVDGVALALEGQKCIE